MSDEAKDQETEGEGEAEGEDARTTVVEYAITALFMTGAIGIVHSIFTARGEGLIAAAIAFGAVALVSVRER